MSAKEQIQKKYKEMGVQLMDSLDRFSLDIVRMVAEYAYECYTLFKTLQIHPFLSIIPGSPEPKIISRPCGDIVISNHGHLICMDYLGQIRLRHTFRMFSDIHFNLDVGHRIVHMTVDPENNNVIVHVLNDGVFKVCDSIMQVDQQFENQQELFILALPKISGFHYCHHRYIVFFKNECQTRDKDGCIGSYFTITRNKTIKTVFLRSPTSWCVFYFDPITLEVSTLDFDNRSFLLKTRDVYSDHSRIFVGHHLQIAILDKNKITLFNYKGDWLWNYTPLSSEANILDICFNEQDDLLVLFKDCILVYKLF